MFVLIIGGSYLISEKITVQGSNTFLKKKSNVAARLSSSVSEVEIAF